MGAGCHVNAEVDRQPFVGRGDGVHPKCVFALRQGVSGDVLCLVVRTIQDDVDLGRTQNKPLADDMTQEFAVLVGRDNDGELRRR